MSYLGGDDDNVNNNVAFVIDNGSGTIKSGMAGTERPKHQTPAVVGTPKHDQVMIVGNKSNQNSVYCGQDAMNSKGLLKLRYPTRHAVVEDWSSMIALWTHVYKLNDIVSSEHPVLLTEAPLNPHKNRKKMAENFFERFNVPALNICQQAILSLYASGRDTGLVVDSGHGVTHCVPVVEGFALKHAITRMDVAGADVTEYLNILLKKDGINFHTSAEMEVVREIKERCCRVAMVGNKQDEDENDPGSIYKLPDGNQIKIVSPKWKAPEILFDPSQIGLEYGGVQDLIDTSIGKSDIDLRRSLYGGIVLSGGSTMFQGFGDRLLYELRKLAQQKRQEVKIRIFAPSERKISTWVGGSILAMLHNFRTSWVTRREYNEMGSSVLFRSLVRK